MSTEATIYINHSEYDQPLLTPGVDWVELDTANDRILITDGSDSVADGELSPSEQAVISAGHLLDGLEYTYDTYLLDDVGSNELKEIFLMGEGNHRYVVAVDFDGATASEPVLEAWDDIDMDTTTSVVLGSGTPALSWLSAITTTSALPGVGWTGNKLAGSADGNFLWLNDGLGPLTEAKTLYFNMKCTIPVSQEDSGSVQPIIVVKYARV